MNRSLIVQSDGFRQGLDLVDDRIGSRLIDLIKLFLVVLGVVLCKLAHKHQLDAAHAGSSTGLFVEHEADRSIQNVLGDDKLACTNGISVAVFTELNHRGSGNAFVALDVEAINASAQAQIRKGNRDGLGHRARSTLAEDHSRSLFGINYGNDNRLRLNMTALIGFRNGGAADGVEQIIRAVGHIVGRKLIELMHRGIIVRSRRGHPMRNVCIGAGLLRSDGNLVGNLSVDIPVIRIHLRFSLFIDIPAKTLIGYFCCVMIYAEEWAATGQFIVHNIHLLDETNCMTFGKSNPFHRYIHSGPQTVAGREIAVAINLQANDLFIITIGDDDIIFLRRFIKVRTNLIAADLPEELAGLVIVDRGTIDVTANIGDLARLRNHIKA